MYRKQLTKKELNIYKNYSQDNYQIRLIMKKL